MRWLVIVVAVLGLALVGAGCGGGDDEAAGDDTTIVTESTDTDSLGTTDDTSTEGVDLSDVLDDEDCVALASAGAAFAQAFSGAGDSEESKAALDELASKVPDEIRADVETLAQALSAYAEKLKDIGVEAGATPSPEQLQQLQSAIASFDQQELTAASNRIEAWTQKNCTG
jgi:aminopeptidase N